MLRNDKPMIYIDSANGISKKNNQPYAFIRLADPITFENYTFFPSDEGFHSDVLNTGDKVNVEFNLTSFKGNPSLNLKTLKKVI